MRRLIVNIDLPVAEITSTPEVSTEPTNIGGFNILINGNELILIPNEPIPNNREIIIEINDIEAEDNSILDRYNLWFTSRYSPMVTTPTMVRLTRGIGPWIQKIPDDTIWRTILKNTIIADQSWGFDENVHIPFNKTPYPWCVSHYVLYTTTLDLLNFYLLELANLAGTKTLADMTITNSGPASMQNLLMRIREELISIVSELQTLVCSQCKTTSIGIGRIGDASGEIRPILDFSLSWKRYPDVEQVSIEWSNMYPQSFGNRDLTNIEQAYERGKLLVVKDYIVGDQ